jgi:hypothetical protein
MESGYALVGPDLSLAEADLGFQLAVKDFDFPAIQIRLDERLGACVQIRGDEIGGLVIFQFPRARRSIRRGHNDDEAQFAALPPCCHRIPLSSLKRMSRFLPP